MSLLEDMAAEGVTASITVIAPGRFHATLDHPKGGLAVEHKALETQDAAEAWLLANVETYYPKRNFARRAFWGRQREASDS